MENNWQAKQGLLDEKGVGDELCKKCFSGVSAEKPAEHHSDFLLFKCSISP